MLRSLLPKTPPPPPSPLPPPPPPPPKPQYLFSWLIRVGFVICVMVVVVAAWASPFSPTQASCKQLTFLFRHYTSITHHLTLHSLSPDVAITTAIRALGTSTTPPTNISRVQLITHTQKYIYIKYTFPPANKQWVPPLHSGPFSCPTQALKSRGSSEMPPNPVTIHTLFSRQFVLAQFSLFLNLLQ